MIKFKGLFLLLLIGLSLKLGQRLNAESAPFHLTRSLVASVSGPTHDSLGRYRLNGSLGEPITSFTLTQDPYSLQSGYWNEQIVSPSHLTYLPMIAKSN